MKIRAGVASLAASFVLAIAMGGPAMAADASVSQVDSQFVPDLVHISEGDTVTWTNTGALPHTATASDSSWDSGAMSPGDKFSHTFDTAGAFLVICQFHQQEGMVMTVVVAPVLPPPSGTTSGEPLPSTGAGSSTGPFIWIGLSLLVAGGGVLLALRRRRA